MIRQHLLLPLLALTSSVCAAPLSGLSAADVNGPAAVAPLEQPQPPAGLIVDPPLAGPLSKGAVFIQYRVENLRIEPVFGPDALKVTPRIGHIHVVVDDAPRHWADTSGEPVILVGLPAGKHKVTIIPPTRRISLSTIKPLNSPCRRMRRSTISEEPEDENIIDTDGGSAGDVGQRLCAE